MGIVARQGLERRAEGPSELCLYHPEEPEFIACEHDNDMVICGCNEAEGETVPKEFGEFWRSQLATAELVRHRSTCKCSASLNNCVADRFTSAHLSSPHPIAM